jgi:acyl-CoA thioester hydrolase
MENTFSPTLQADQRGGADESTPPHVDLPLNVRQVRVRMHHTDLLGAVYHGTYFDLFEEARTEIFRSLGYTYLSCTEEEGRLMTIVRAACDYKRPACMDALLSIAVTVPDITRAKITFAYEVRLAASNDLIARGEHVFAFLDVRTNRPTSTPPHLVALIKQTPEFAWSETASTAARR